MLHSISSSNLPLRTAVMSLAAALIVGGIWHARNISLNLVPEFSSLSLEVHTEALDVSASEVESKFITSLLSIVMFIALGTDLMRARQMVQERLTQAHALPNVSSPPVMLQPISSPAPWRAPRFTHLVS